MMNIIGAILIVTGLMFVAGSAGDCDGKCMEYANTMEEMVFAIVIGLTLMAIGGIIIGIKKG